MISTGEYYCYLCYERGHFSYDCSQRKPCKRCHKGDGIIKKVRKDTENKGRLFMTCSEECGYFAWFDMQAPSNSTSISNDKSEASSSGVGQQTQEMSKLESMVQLFEKSVRIVDKKGEVKVMLSKRDRVMSVTYNDGKK